MGTMASQITSLIIVYSTVYSGADQRKHQSSASLASVRGIHRGPVNSPHKWPVTRKMFPFDDVIMYMLAVYRYRITPRALTRFYANRYDMAYNISNLFCSIKVILKENLRVLNQYFPPPCSYHDLDMIIHQHINPCSGPDNDLAPYLR